MEEGREETALQYSLNLLFLEKVGSSGREGKDDGWEEKQIPQFLILQTNTKTVTNAYIHK